jgi:signal transduction histidine kinase
VPAGNTRELSALSDGVNRMTDRLLAEQTIRVRTEKLASVGRLAAGIAHEIGNPLGAINGYAHILRRRCGDDQGVADAVGGLERESGRIDRIVRGLLDYARPRHATPARIDLNAAVCASMHLLGEQGALRQVDLQLALDPCVPCVVGDAHELEQVFVNLVLNALDAMDHRGRLSITTHRVLGPALHEGARRASDALEAPIPARDPSRLQRWLARVGPDASTVKVIVADSGPGIPEADVERVFDPFYTTKAPGQGTGLGLAIVARTVENLQGTVWVQPAREGGAAFHLLFPLAGSTPLPDERSRR